MQQFIVTQDNINTYDVIISSFTHNGDPITEIRLSVNNRLLAIPTPVVKALLTKQSFEWKIIFYVGYNIDQDVKINGSLVHLWEIHHL